MIFSAIRCCLYVAAPFIYPMLHPAEFGKTFGGIPPLGMASITSFLQSKNISTALVDLQISDCSVEQLLQ